MWYPFGPAAFHLNALKFLEDSPCANCLSITKMTPQGDGIIDVDVQIRHPYQNLTYSAFDVKGIIMFNGSINVYTPILRDTYPELHFCQMNWWRLGDWELLNPDGWTFRWSPQWNPDGVYPIDKYWPGKLSNGTPTSAINAYCNFYTDEDRHLFRASGEVTRTYSIKTQPGPMTVGYAIEACWEPPTTVPVTNPLTDFPTSANQDEPYQFSVVINDGAPVHQNLWTMLDNPWHGAIKTYVKQWGPLSVDKMDQWQLDTSYKPGTWEYGGVEGIEKCYADVDYYCGGQIGWGSTPAVGWYRTIWDAYYGTGGDWHDHTFTVTDFLIDNN